MLAEIFELQGEFSCSIFVVNNLLLLVVLMFIKYKLVTKRQTLLYWRIYRLRCTNYYSTLTQRAQRALKKYDSYKSIHALGSILEHICIQTHTRVHLHSDGYRSTKRARKAHMHSDPYKSIESTRAHGPIPGIEAIYAFRLILEYREHTWLV